MPTNFADDESLRSPRYPRVHSRQVDRENLQNRECFQEIHKTFALMLNAAQEMSNCFSTAGVHEHANQWRMSENVTPKIAATKSIGGASVEETRHD